MRHVPDGVLRRLDDEPLAVPDSATDHVAECARCSARQAHIAHDTEQASQLLSVPQVMPDTDLAWARLRRDLRRSEPQKANPVRRPRPVRRWRTRLPTISVRAGLVLGGIAIVVAGTAAAATLTPIFAPTHVAPLTVTQGDVQAISDVFGLGGGQALGGFPAANGARRFRFGTIKWSSSSPSHPAGSPAQASAEAGFRVPLPTHRPAGVGAIQQLIVQPRVSATVAFGSTAAGVAGSSVTLHAGPAVVAQYGASSGTGIPTLVVATMRRPTALSRGASLTQIEAFLLAQPGIPPELAEEVRLLGDLKTTLPVPVPSGAVVRSVRVDGWPGVLPADSSNAAAGVVWEDGRGMLHAVAGLLDKQDVLNVAAELG